MGHFNVLKGQYPSLSQLEETLAVSALESGIVRGSALVKSSSTWVRGTDSNAGVASSPGPVVYFALQGQNDPDVMMSKKVTALPCLAPIRVETDQYDDSISASDVGKFLSVATTGIVGLAASGGTACGILTSAPTTRWSNNSGPYTGFPGARTGEKISIVTFWCVYIPMVTVA